MTKMQVLWDHTEGTSKLHPKWEKTRIKNIFPEKKKYLKGSNKAYVGIYQIRLEIGSRENIPGTGNRMWKVSTGEGG